MVVGESQAATWLTQVINKGVEQHDLRLVASHTKRSAPACMPAFRAGPPGFVRGIDEKLQVREIGRVRLF